MWNIEAGGMALTFHGNIVLLDDRSSQIKVVQRFVASRGGHSGRLLYNTFSSKAPH